MKMIAYAVSLVWLTALLGGCNLFGGSTPTPTPARLQPGQPASVRNPVTPTPGEQEIVTARAREIVAYMRQLDMAKFSACGHPTAGIRFSPFATVKNSDRVLRVSEIQTAYNDSTVLSWGVSSSTGQPVNLTFRNYFMRYVYNIDFGNAPQVGYNQTIGKSRDADNSREFFPGGNMVEFHIPGIEPKYNGADWQSLRLVLRKDGQIWYLVGVIHAGGMY